MSNFIDFIFSNWSSGTALETIYQGATAYPRGARIGPASWPHFDLLIVPRGRVVVVAGDVRLTCGDGSALLIPPHCPFQGTIGPRGALLWVQHFRAGRSQPGKVPELLPGNAVGEWTQSLMRRLADIQSRSQTGPHPESGIVLQLLLSALMENRERVRNDSGPSGARIESLVAPLETSPPPLPSVDELVMRSGWSTSQFRYHFTKYTGLTPGEFLRRLRMKLAQKLLIESTQPIKEIALLVGYSDPVSFHRAFVAHAHTTPGKFRATHPRII